VSESKVHLAAEVERLKRENSDLTWKLVRLLTYVANMKVDEPDLDWPDLPDSYSAMMWRYAR